MRIRAVPELLLIIPAQMASVPGEKSLRFILPTPFDSPEPKRIASLLTGGRFGGGLRAALGDFFFKPRQNRFEERVLNQPDNCLPSI